MKIHKFALDELIPQVRTWMNLIDRARRTDEGEIVPSFLEIISTIISELKMVLENPFSSKELKSIFIGISVIQYLNDKYAIEKVMMFAKGRCRVSLPSPSKQINQFTEKFVERFSNGKQDDWSNQMGKLMNFLFKKDFKAARDATIPLQPYFKKKFDEKTLSLLEATFYSLIRGDIIPIIMKNLKNYQTEVAQDPISIYFSILKNIIVKIQYTQDQRKSALQGLLHLFNNLSQLE